MSKLPSNVELRKKRFLLNMGRIGRLSRLKLSDVEIGRTGRIFTVEGAVADLKRALVVFLHATFEDLLRGLMKKPGKKLSFYSRSDLDKFLSRAGIDPAPFKFLYPPLTEMAKRRKRIVHDADLPSREDTAINEWTLVDTWQLILWNLAVLAFFYQMLISTKTANLMEKTMYKRQRRAMEEHVRWFKNLLGTSMLPTELRGNALKRMYASLTSIQRIMDIDIDDFAIEVWDPELEIWEKVPVDGVLETDG